MEIYSIPELSSYLDENALFIQNQRIEFLSKQEKEDEEKALMEQIRLFDLQEQENKKREEYNALEQAIEQVRVAIEDNELEQAIEQVRISIEDNELEQAIEQVRVAIEEDNKLEQAIEQNIQVEQTEFIETNSDKYNKKYIIIKEFGDGNCLFRALARYITGNSENYPIMRNSIVGHLFATDDWYAYIDRSKYETNYTYLSHISKNGTYGDNIEIKAFVDMTKCSIIIHNTIRASINPITEILANDNNSQELHLLYNGDHYDTLI